MRGGLESWLSPGMNLLNINNCCFKRAYFIAYLSMKRLPILIILVFALLHFYGISHPPIDHHGQRQSDTMEVARLFLEEDAGLLTPRVGRRNEHTGITGLEFPIFNYLIYSCLELRELFLTGGRGIPFDKGIEKTYPVRRILSPGAYVASGRILSLIFSVIGMVFFYLLMLKLQGKETAIFSLFALSASMTWFYFSRNVQPDVPSVSLAICGLYFFTGYLEEGSFLKRRFLLLISAVSFSLAGLMKPPALVLLFPAAYLALRKDYFRSFLNPDYIFFVAIIALPLILWFNHAEHLSSKFGLRYFFLGKPFREAAVQVFTFKFIWTFIKRMMQEYTSWALAPFLIYGFYLLKNSKNLIFYLFWVAGFVLYAFKAGERMEVHDYYGLPLVPALSAICGSGLKRAVEEYKKLKFVFMAIVLIIPVHLYGSYKLNDTYLIGVEERIHGVVPYSAKIAVNGGRWPVHLYMIHRRGWSLSRYFSNDLRLVEKLRKKGLEYIVLTGTFDRKKTEMLYKEKVIVSEKDLMVVKL